MSKVLLVFGATGQQGRSVVDYVLNDSELSKEFRVRAIVRDPSKPAAQELQQRGVEVVQGDADDAQSVKHAMQGVHTVFGMTATVYDERLRERELAQGKTMADAAVAAGAQYFIFSTLPNGFKTSGGQIKHLDHFDVKAEIEEYIRTLSIESSFFAPGSFMQNFQTIMAPHPAGDGSYAMANFVTPETKLPLIDIVGDTGKYVGAVLAQPQKFAGKTVAASTALYSFREIAETMSKVSGKSVKYNQLPEDVFRSFLPPPVAVHLIDMFRWIQDYGYYGPQTAPDVKWAADNARGKLSTLEEYLTKTPLNLA